MRKVRIEKTHGIDVGAGVIDPDYRGNVGIVLFNLGQEDYSMRRGDRCAQIILEQIYVPLVVEVEHLDKTGRGMGSFGSTGKLKKKKNSGRAPYGYRKETTRRKERCYK